MLVKVSVRERIEFQINIFRGIGTKTYQKHVNTTKQK